MRNFVFGLLALCGILFLAGCDGSNAPSPPPLPPPVFTVTQYGGDGKVISQWRTTYWYLNDGAVVFKCASTGDQLHVAIGTVVVEPVDKPDTAGGATTHSIRLYKDDGTVLRQWEVNYWYLNGGAIVFRAPGDDRNLLVVTGSAYVGPHEQ